ncbi:TOBE domain-containing protein [Hydrogenophaga crocea]|uniref:TOBE domain-containing protein n=1 Tax=Hydrogenophaga crocea TaxID=2716225 RepID=A0A6G8IG28_9BURK|nr:TOBE domain-containing protein [Hydrogenophaga crocea]QIM51995.1 TOBE domain-containing protein [Hydrogenophaga crocea]
MATKKNRGKQRLQVHGALWLSMDGANVAGQGRIALLRAVAKHGSITQAAKAFGMSYKAAWDAIDTMNQRSRTPVVERVTGGRGGGSTLLTAYGQRLVERYAQVQAVHQRFLQLLEQDAMDLEQPFSMLKVLNMKTSARNQWLGEVTAVHSGAVNDEVELRLPGGQRLSAMVTRDSTGALGLKPQLPVIALVKSSAVLLAVDLETARVSAGNRLAGTVVRVTPGAVNAEVIVRTPDAAGVDGALEVVAVVPQTAVAELGLKPGAAVTALVKASDVVLAVVS